MNYDVYAELLEQEKYEDAVRYKCLNIPDVLYKYSWLDDDVERNELRLATLEAGQIYLSTIEQFNDPFEGKAFIFDPKRLKEKGWKKEQFEEFIKEMNSKWRICCFANPDEKEQNMPMWAYYANNHRGFCVEYKMAFEQKKFIYPVSYDESRVWGNVVLGNLLNGIMRMIKEGKDSSQMPGNVSVYNHLSLLSLTCKHASWQHEKEFRALVPTAFGIYFPAIPSKIFIGMNCSEQNTSRIVEIAKKFPNCEVYKMKDALEGVEFYLEEQIL